VIRWFRERMALLAEGERIYEAGKAFGIAQERFRLLCGEDGDCGPEELAACWAALDQAQAAGEAIGKPRASVR
jgi:hypothetical protein